MVSVEFVVEQAGCPSCATRVRDALEPFATVAAIEIDEEADAAAVRLVSSSPLSEEAIGGALRSASIGSGHEYRVQSESWTARA